MKKSWIAAVMVIAGLMIAIQVLNALIPENRIEYSTDYQHQVNSGANPRLGEDTLSTDFNVDAGFVSHLPLVIIDLEGRELPNVYGFSQDGTARVYTEDGLLNNDPWVDADICIINNDDYVNHIGDEPEFENRGKIKLRGMTSRDFQKKQYGIKLMDGEEELEASILGMEADEDWVLSNSLLDLSGMRNYLAMNIGRQIFPYTSEVRFCEVILKDEEEYTYQGLYLLAEKVKKADGRIQITDYDEDAASLSYVVCRDRKDETQLTLSTWASENEICYGHFTMVYPKEELLTEESIGIIEAELSTIEQVLYSEDPEIFATYSKYIDVDSFVDYYIVNEFFQNYDAGNNSTYYYKNKDGKLAIGPLWDYDSCLDNYIYGMAGMEYAPFSDQPWFEMLLKDAQFQEKIVERYDELRQGVLNEEYIHTFLDEGFAYLGNARERDYFRWKEVYESEHLLMDLENSEGILIERNVETPKAEVQRMKDVITLHGRWMDDHLSDSLKIRAVEAVEEVTKFDATGIVIIGIMAFVATVVILLRLVKGQYR